MEDLSQGEHLSLPDVSGELRLDLLQDQKALQDPLLPFFGEQNQLGATVRRIWDALDDAELVEFFDEFGHRLFTDPATLCQRRDAGPLEIDVREERGVGGAQADALTRKLLSALKRSLIGEACSPEERFESRLFFRGAEPLFVGKSAHLHF